MPIEGQYEPSTIPWVAEQVAEYEASGGTRANTLRDTGIPVFLVTMRGRRSGLVRKIALMRVEHDGEYALVASRGGAPDHPDWYANLLADPRVEIQDGPTPFDAVVREVTGAERDLWWERAVAVFPTYADYEVSAAAAGRVIPVLIASAAEH
ncbi:MAG: nitroreductase family deazaflavin-dependent oxidoreductase [Ilumatobacteraceae bacterium]|jgi:deazaflavin-dependent oxidoreductase (nitroreductase family)